MRKSKPKKRYLLPDPKFSDTLVTKFVNYMMDSGKKSVAYNIFYDAIAQVEKKVGGEPGLDVWKRAMNNVMPGVEVKSRRVGGATFQVPVEIRPERKMVRQYFVTSPSFGMTVSNALILTGNWRSFMAVKSSAKPNAPTSAGTS